MGEADPRVGAGVKVSQSLMGKLKREVLALGEQGGSWGGVFAEALRGFLRVDCVEGAACAGGDEALWAALEKGLRGRAPWWSSPAQVIRVSAVKGSCTSDDCRAIGCGALFRIMRAQCGELLH